MVRRKMIGFKVPTHEVIAWGIFDWANSAFPIVVTTFVFATYFTRSIAKNQIEGTSQWGNTIALAGLIIAVISPILGAVVDRMGRRKPWLAFFVLLTMLSSALLWFAKPSANYAAWAMTWVVIGTASFEIGTVFYNAMMRGLATESYWGRLSGWAWSCGYVGGIACLMLSFLLLKTSSPWLNTDPNSAEHIRICGPLVALWLLFFGWPLFVFTSEKSSKGNGLRKSLLQGITMLFHTLRQWREQKQVMRFLFARMLYIDGLNTLFAFGGIYAAGTFGFNAGEIIIFGIAMNVAAGLGALIFAWVDDYIGSKKTILIALTAMIIAGTFVLIVHSYIGFWLLALFLSLFVGPVQAASRSLMIKLSPEEYTTELFGLYALSGKATAFICPWLVGLIALYFNNQRIGMGVVILFLFLGALVLRKVKVLK